MIRHEVEFLNTKSISSSIDSIINEAKEELFIVSPFMSLSSYYIDRLMLAAKRGVHITFIYGKKEPNKETQTRLSKLDNIRLAYREPLHAKCYLNDNTLLISSMNLHEYSENYNDEMGILISGYGSGEIIKKAKAEILRILELSTIKKDNLIPRDPTPKWYCIRCKEEIPKNVYKPYCSKHYDSYRDYNNPHHQEKYCHKCGSEARTSMNKPLCDECRQI
jgi:phosphatidylserine/phosphatidylglycerophosphate/cardiolipin synthase-like enzyme